jgi:hypothetical protein
MRMYHRPMTGPRYDALAGATLDHVTVDWRNATARVTFLPSKDSHEAHALRVSELSVLQIARTASASRIVREATRTSKGAHHVAVSLTMETGEKIEIEAGVIVLEQVGG